jgi:hypothetical protein
MITNVSPEQHAKLHSILTYAVRAAMVFRREGAKPCLIFMDWPESKAKPEIVACHAAGYRPAGVVALTLSGQLVYEVVDQESEPDVIDARDEFGCVLCAEACAPAAVN